MRNLLDFKMFSHSVLTQTTWLALLLPLESHLASPENRYSDIGFIYDMHISMIVTVELTDTRGQSIPKFYKIS